MTATTKFKGILEDLTFKYLFRNVRYLEDFINSYFDYVKEEKRFYFAKIETENEILANKMNIKTFYGDIVATLNTGEIISVEAYTSFSKNEYKKSFNYMARLYSNQIEDNNTNYTKANKVISLNLMFGNYRNLNYEIVNKYEVQNSITHKVLDNGEIEMILIRLDLLKSIAYNINETRFIKWLKLISAKTIEEMQEAGRNDEVMEDAIKYVERYLDSNLNRSFDDYVVDKQLEADKKSKLQIAKNLLNMKLSINDIAKVTGLSIIEIKKLQEKMV